jgi:hypothetical protein
MEKIWFKDLGNFISEKNYDKFFPAVSYTYVEKLNSLMRLSMYFSVIAFIIKKDTNILFVPIFMAVFTYFLFKSEETSKRANEDFLDKMNLYKDPHTNEICYKPKENNPFMNILMDDYKHNPKRAKACNVSNGNIKKMATKYFNNNLYRDVGDIFHRNASDRNYYTTAVTTIPNDQDAFLNFAYKIDKTCKEGNGRVCYANTFRTTGN